MRAASQWLLCVMALGLGACVDSAPAGPRPILWDAGHFDGGPPGRIDTDLPCDVAQLLARHCTSCHGSTPSAGALMPLVSHADLLAPAPTLPSQTVAERSLARMRDAMRPMPPAGAGPDAAAIAAFEAWIGAGTPAGTCTIDDPFAGPGRCTSGTRWSGGDDGSPLMYPGHGCVECHARMREGPLLRIAGTVYPSGHEPDSCNGMSGVDGVRVEITTGSGRVLSLRPNAAGNFLYEDEIAFPYTARVIRDGRVREMVSSQTSGDCNVCHTSAGVMDAPGRIVAP